MVALATIVSALVAVLGLYVNWRTAREAALRRGDVLQWANRVIESLQTLCLLCTLEDGSPALEERQAKLAQIIFATSVLVEQGRMFFKNRTDNPHGREKIRAYQGFRPLILDQIVMAHQIAVAWTNAALEERLRMQLLSDDCLKQFVSLVQLEVGRSRTAVAETNQPGLGSQLSYRLQALDRSRVEQARRRIAM